MVMPMRNVEISSGLMEIRPLTRKEIKAGKDVGLKYVGVQITPDNFDEVLDYCLGCQFADYVLDGMANPDQHSLFRAVIAETWGSPGEEKNSPTSGTGSQTDSESSTAETAENPNASKE